jgi:hypothetical protein
VWIVAINCQLGKKMLDAEQEVAFEVLTATYVLTFNDEANDNLDDQAAAEFIKNKNRLWNWQDETTTNNE